MKIIIIVLSVFVFIVDSCGQPVKQTEQSETDSLMVDIEGINRQKGNVTMDTTEYIIWKLEYGIAPFSGDNGIHGEISYSYFWINEDFIKSLPPEIKTNVAFYSTLVPNEYFVGYDSEPKSDIILANALGDFSTLKEAQETLLRNNVMDYKIPNNDFPKALKIKIVNDEIYFEGILNNEAYTLFLPQIVACKDQIIEAIRNIEPIYVVVNEVPRFQGDSAYQYDSLMRYINQSLNYPATAIHKGISGRVLCQFVVEKDGSITDIKVIRGLDPDCDKEALRLIKGMPKWIPGKLNGKVVRCKHTLPIIFKSPGMSGQP